MVQCLVTPPVYDIHNNFIGVYLSLTTVDCFHQSQAAKSLAEHSCSTPLGLGKSVGLVIEATLFKACDLWKAGDCG